MRVVFAWLLVFSSLENVAAAQGRAQRPVAQAPPDICGDLWYMDDNSKSRIAEDLKQGADPNGRCRGWLLIDLAMRKPVYAVSALLQGGANPNILTNGGQTPLGFAVDMAHLSRDYEDKLRILLDHGANPNLPDSSGRTATQLAAQYGNQSLLNRLIKAGGVLGDFPSDGPFELRRALVQGEVDRTLQLLKYNIELLPRSETDKSWRFRETPLHVAAGYGHTRLVEALLNNGAKIDATDSFGMTALHLAAMGGKDEIVQLLLAKGAASTVDRFQLTYQNWLVLGKQDIRDAFLNSRTALDEAKALSMEGRPSQQQLFEAYVDRYRRAAQPIILGSMIYPQTSEEKAAAARAIDERLQITPAADPRTAKQLSLQDRATKLAQVVVEADRDYLARHGANSQARKVLSQMFLHFGFIDESHAFDK